MYSMFIGLFLSLSLMEVPMEPQNRSEFQIRESSMPIIRTVDGVQTREPIVPLVSDTLTYDKNLYSGIWLPGSYKQKIFSSKSWTDFEDNWSKQGNKGFRMEDFEAFNVGIFTAYLGVFNEGTDIHAAFITSDWNEFEAKWDDWGKQNLRMHDFETYTFLGYRMYVGIFREGKDKHAALITDDFDNFTSTWENWGKEDLRMHDFETYVEDGKRWYAGIFREGTDRNAAWITDDWNSFVKQWNEFYEANLRLTDYEVYQDGNATVFAGIFREGTGGSYAWLNVEWENLASKWQELMPYNLRLVDLEVTAVSACTSDCMNQVVMHCDPSVAINDCRYDYAIPGDSLHCEGDPDNCPSGFLNTGAVYHQPAFTANNARYIYLPALDIKDQIFTLPFSAQNLQHNGWLYSPGNWHHAVDYYDSVGGTFEVKAAAPGRVIYIGWDKWSGNTMILSHDAGGVKDAYRTIYMHLRNGRFEDCSKAWSQTIPWLQGFSDQTTYEQYEAFLEDTGCSENPFFRNPDGPQWGTDSQAIDMSLLGTEVERGDLLGFAGSTGPGGCGCVPDDGTMGITDPNNHLHIFFAHRNPADQKWYLFDPYGIYGHTQCYPAGMTDPLNVPCVRYPVAWKNAKPEYP